MKRNRPEDEIQKAVVMWLAIQENLGKLTYFAIPNNPRSVVDGARLKQMGLRAGTPDLCILAKDHIPLFIELKAPNGRVSIDQQIAFGRLKDQRAMVVVCRSLDDVRMIVAGWLAVTITEARAA